jgi:hypothetical protein
MKQDRKLKLKVLFLLLLAGAVSAQVQNAPVAKTRVAVPQINQPLVPEAATPGSSGFTLTVNGAGFVPKSTARWNGKPLTTMFVSSTQLKATIASGLLANARTASVTVFSPGAGGGQEDPEEGDADEAHFGTSNIDFFQVTNPSSATFSSATYASSDFTQRLAAVDLNGDGKPDLVRTLPFLNEISVELGIGGGTFAPPVYYPTPAGGPNDLVVRDFNGDGNLDVAVNCMGVVALLLGNPDGTLKPYKTSAIDLGVGTFGIAAGDFNRDGKLDLVVGYQTGNDVAVLLGKGDGTFKPPDDLTTNDQPAAVTVADLNRDGNLDIVAANFGQFAGNTVSVLLGNGDGTFQPQQQYTTASGALWVIAADFNGDGIPDLAVDCACGNGFCGYPGDVSILIGNGDGTFQPRADYDLYGFPYTVSSGDYNGDGYLDLLVTNLDYSQVSLLLGNGDGTFAAASVAGTTGPSPVGIAPGDFDGNGLLDAVIGTAGGYTLLMQ